MVKYDVDQIPASTSGELRKHVASANIEVKISFGSMRYVATLLARQT
jgi:hypothetical protein